MNLTLGNGMLDVIKGDESILLFRDPGLKAHVRFLGVESE